MYQAFLESLAGTAIGYSVSTSVWIFPTLETLHFIGLAMLVGGIAALDLRVLGVAKELPIKPFHRLLPLVFIGFGVNLVTGILFFLADPVGYGNNPAFVFKMVLVLLAGLNALWFEFAVSKGLASLGGGSDAPSTAKVICSLSLAFWAGIIIAGRLLPSFAALL